MLLQTSIERQCNFYFPSATSSEDPVRLRRHPEHAQNIALRAHCITIATTSHVAKVATMTRSLRLVNPTLPCTLVLVEREPLDPATRALLVDVDEVLLADEVFGEGLAEWASTHSAFETSCVLKPAAARHLLSRDGVDAVIYLDADTDHHTPLTPLLEALESAALVITPHLTHLEEPFGATSQAERDCFVYGMYNTGIFGVSDQPEARRFLNWWDTRLREHCSISGVPYLDQGLIDLAPGLFDQVRILRHRGCNVATWNAANRIVSRTVEGSLRVGDEPLVFCHYAAWDSGQFHGALPPLRTRNPEFVALADDYERRLTDQQGRFDLSDEWSFSTPSAAER